MFGYVNSDIESCKFLTVDKRLVDKERYWVEVISDAYFLAVPESVEHLNQQHSKKSIYNIKRAEKKFMQDFPCGDFKVLSSKQEISKYLRGVRVLFAERWKGRYVSLGWKKINIFNKFAQFYLELALHNRSRLFVLTDSSKVIAFHVCIIKNNTLYVFQHAVTPDEKYKKSSLGRIITYNLLKHIINNEPDIKVVDFMYGDNEYKRFWTNESKPVYCLYKKSYKGLVCLTSSKFKNLVKKLVIAS